MDTISKKVITVETTVDAPIEEVWDFWNKPEHVTQWCAASDDWHVPSAENDFREGGKSKTTIAAKDGSFSFDFEWIYNKIKNYEVIEYTIVDGRKVDIKFKEVNGGVKITESFEAEDTNPIEMQQGGWQAILNNFKKYTESK